MKQAIGRLIPKKIRQNATARKFRLKLEKLFAVNTLTEGNAEGLIEKISVGNATDKIFAICHPEYRGIKTATYKNFANVIEVREFHLRKTASKIAKRILELCPELVVLNGYPFGYELIAEELSKQNPKLKIYTFCHGPFIWFDFFPAENPVFNRYLELNQKGIVQKLGFCKKDLSEYFKLQGYNTAFVMNRFDLNNSTKKTVPNIKELKIGIFGSAMWHRNLLNQVLGALMIPGAEIHVNEIHKQDFIDNSRIVQHGMMPHDEYLKVFQGMDLALYVSFTDSFPMTLIESMSYGIPAIASATSDVYSFDTKLKNSLVVAGVDSPIAIANKIRQVVDNYADIQNGVVAYCPKLHEEVEKSLEEFLEYKS